MTKRGAAVHVQQVHVRDGAEPGAGEAEIFRRRFAGVDGRLKGREPFGGRFKDQLRYESASPSLPIHGPAPGATMCWRSTVLQGAEALVAEKLTRQPTDTYDVFKPHAVRPPMVNQAKIRKTKYEMRQLLGPRSQAL